MGYASGPYMYYYQYAHKSSLGNWLGLYELLAGIAFMVWSIGSAFLGAFVGDLMWAKLDQMNKDGEKLTEVDGYRFMGMGIGTGISAWIAAIAVMETVDEVIEWYQNYNPAAEANQNGVTDSEGTSIVSISPTTLSRCSTFTSDSQSLASEEPSSLIWASPLMVPPPPPHEKNRKWSNNIDLQ